MKKFITLIAAVFCAVAVNSQTLDNVLKNYYDAIGGSQKWSGIKTLTLTGKMSMQGMEITYKSYQKEPSKFKTEMEIMGQKIVQAYDGETAWMINPMTGNTAAQKMNEQQAEVLKNSATMGDPLVDYKTKGYQVTLEGSEEVEGIDCYVIKLIKKEGEPGAMLYLDKDSYLPLFTKETDPQMGQEVLVVNSDFQDIGNGMIMPFLIETKLQGQTVTTITFTDIKVNQSIDDSEFAFPEEI